MAKQSDGTMSTSGKRKRGFRLPWQKKRPSKDAAAESAQQGVPELPPPILPSAYNGAVEPQQLFTRVPAVHSAALPTPKIANTTASESSSRQKPAHIKSSWFCRSRQFRKMCDWAFENVDTDQSGEVDEKELYSGLLLIHLNLGMYAGPAACKPLSRERCHAVFEKFDVDGSGSLDKNEFREVMMVLFGNVIMRVLVQWCMTLMIVPLVARRLLHAFYGICDSIYLVVTNLDEYSSIANAIELSLEAVWEFFVSSMPGPVLQIMVAVGDWLEMVPDSIWNALPLTIISTILGIVVVPWIIFKIDDVFQWLADHRRKEAVQS